MIYLHTYYITSRNLCYHNFYNINDNTYYYVVGFVDCVASTYITESFIPSRYYKGDISLSKGIEYYECFRFEYELPKNIKIIMLDYHSDRKNSEMLRDLENSKLKIILNSI